MKTVIISLGGSLISPQPGKVDYVFLKNFRDLLLRQVRQGYRFVIITGGGAVCRLWQETARKLEVHAFTDLDWIGIRATQLNAELLRSLFGKVAYPEVVADPKRRVHGFKILIGCGYVPGSSTDYDAVLRARLVRAPLIFNFSNIAYVYDKDPQRFSKARILPQLSWSQYLKLIGTRHRPGLHVPFDPQAAQAAKRYGIGVAFINGKKDGGRENFLRCLAGDAFPGTLIQ